MSDWESCDSIGKALVLGAPVIMQAYVELSFPLVTGRHSLFTSNLLLEQNVFSSSSFVIL